ISNADPKRTLLKLTDPIHLSPDFVQKLQHYRGNGTVAKVNLALSALPKFAALKNGDNTALKGRIHIGNEIDYLERAFDDSKYGLTGGWIFHGDLALDQLFHMRPVLDWARYKTPIENLYLCGSGTHPGAGLTGGSGANAAREILKELKK